MGHLRGAGFPPSHQLLTELRSWKIQTKLFLSALTEMEVKLFHNGGKGDDVEIWHRYVELTFIPAPENAALNAVRLERPR